MNYSRISGPAFPGHGSMGEVANEGMMLRDYFAAKAMQSLLSSIDEYPDEHWRTGIAIDAYQMADAMLKVREDQQ